MDGTVADNLDAKRREPSPLMGEVEGRLRDICTNGAEPWNDPLEVRRETRRRDMEILRLASMESALHTTEYIAGRLPGWKRGAFETVRDPLASLANLNRSIIQITLAEDRFDESGEERAARIKAEAEAKAKAEQAAEAQRAYSASQRRRAENKRQVQSAVRAITLDSLDLDYEDRETLLDALFLDFDLQDGNYGRDPADIVAELCARLDVTGGAPDGEAVSTGDTPIDPATRRARTLAMAREYLDALKPAAVSDDDRSAPILVAARAQGPPN